MPNQLMEKITVFLCDDHPIVREGLRMLLASAPDICVVGDAADGREAVREVLRLQPNVVLMDAAMPLLNGIDAARQISRACPLIKVVMLSSYCDEQRMAAALDAGVAGYFTKSTVGDDLLEALRAVHQGKCCFGPTMLKHLSKQWQKNGNGRKLCKSAFRALSCRQSEILQLIAEGFSSKQIGVIIGINHKTVEKHRQSLMDKLDIHEISTLTRYALSAGVIELAAAPLRKRQAVPATPIVRPLQVGFIPAPIAP
jgi:DNA-binding NarL/FixJ family response regulator